MHAVEPALDVMFVSFPVSFHTVPWCTARMHQLLEFGKHQIEAQLLCCSAMFIFWRNYLSILSKISQVAFAVLFAVSGSIELFGNGSDALVQVPSAWRLGYLCLWYCVSRSPRQRKAIGNRALHTVNNRYECI
jgi:hypothetical protein